jgi:pimeloyl-ACP methyl ester carboxylesterase
MRSPLPIPEVVVRGAIARMYRSMAFARPRAVDDAAISSFTRHVSSKRDVVRILGTGHRVVSELRDLPFQLDRVRCPVLIVWGERDRMVFPAGAERVLAKVPNSRLELLPDCGHCPQVEEPERLADLLAGFPAELAAAA